MVEVEDSEQIGNASPCCDESEDVSLSTDDLDNEKASFYKMLLFLWAVMKDHKSVPGTPVTVCNKKFTKNWEDQQHQAYIKSPSPLKRKIATSQNQQRGYCELTDQLEELHNNLTARKFDTTRDKEEEDSSGMKRFKKLSKVHQNIIRMFTITEYLSEEDVDDLVPASGMLEMLASQGVYDAQGLIHKMLKRNGNVAFIQTGICTSLMKGFITPIGPKMPSNLTPFGTYATLSSTSNLDTKALLKFAMKQNYERFDKEDLDFLTSMEITIPKTYYTFHHMLRNMQFLCEHLSGPDSLASKAWEAAAKHAGQNE